MTTQREPGSGRPGRPGRPRSERAERSIIEAVIELMSEGMGVTELSIEAIAQRAGVGKTTIYRRWPGKEELIVDALATLKAPVPDLGHLPVRDALVSYLRLLQEESRHPRTRCIMDLALSERRRYPDMVERFRKLAIEPRRAALLATLHRGVASGELRADLDVEIALAVLTGAMLHFTRWTNCDAELPADLPERIVDNVLSGLGGGRPAG